MKGIILLVLVMACVAAGPVTKPTSAPVKPLTFETAVASMPKDLRAALGNSGNPVVEERLAKWVTENLVGKRFRYHGEISDIRQDERAHAIRAAVRDPQRGQRGVTATDPHPDGICWFADSQKDALSKLKGGESVKVQGAVKSFQFIGKTGFYAEFSDCELER